MTRNWTPRQLGFRRFQQLHDALEKSFQYVEDIRTLHIGRADSVDVIAYADELKTLVAQTDKCVDILQARFKTGQWPKEVTSESDKPVDSERDKPPVS